MTDTKDLPGFTLNFGPLRITWRSLFALRIKYVSRFLTGERVPLFERLSTMQETDEPWRRGHGLVFRLWPTRYALGLGWWGDPIVGEAVGDSQALYEVIGIGDNKFTPITRLMGRATEEEVVDRAALRILASSGDDVADDSEYDSLTVIDLREDDDDVVSG